MNRSAGSHAVTPGFMQYSPHPPFCPVSCLYPPPLNFSYTSLLHIPLIRHASSSVSFPHFFFSLPNPFPTVFCIQILPFPKAPTQMRPFTKQNQAPSASLLATHIHSTIQVSLLQQITSCTILIYMFISHQSMSSNSKGTPSSHCCIPSSHRNSWHREARHFCFPSFLFISLRQKVTREGAFHCPSKCLSNIST